jgi:hypothetical protein
MRSLLLLTLVAGCDVGSLSNGGVGGSDGGTTDPNACVARGTPPAEHLHATGGTTNAGMNCMDGVACHAAGGAGGAYSAAGTVYKNDGTTPNPGAVVRIKNGTQVLTTIADTAGNFRFLAATQPISFPAQTDISACPDQIPMVTPLQTGQGSCAMAGCHVAGVQGPVMFQN